jgi:putative tricarboxylic transport membrane protein
MEIMGFNILSLLTPLNIGLLILGSFVGILIGAIPGMGTLLTIAILLPLTYKLPPLTAVIMILAAYQGSEYGGSISAITLGIPGTPAAAATVLDGNVLARRESPGKSITYSLTASTLGGFAGALVLLFLTKPLGQFALKFSAPDFCLLGLIGILAVVSLSSKDIVKGLIMVVLGLMLGTIGIDSFTGTARFTAGFHELMDGLNMITLVVGVFAFPEVFTIISDTLHKRYVTDTKSLYSRLNAREYRRIVKPTLIGSITGSVVGIFPGLGAGVSSWFAYLIAKKTSKRPETFGDGNPEGIAAPEAANNATVGGAMLPLLALGIPGSAAVAIIGSAFLIHGIQLGPTLFNTNVDLVYGVFFGLFLSVIVMYILGRLLTPAFARLLTVRNSFLVPLISIFTIIGVFAEKKLYFNLWVALIIGIIVFFMKRLNFSLPTLVLSFVLCPIIETNFRRALSLSDGSYSIFYKTTSSKIILIILIIIMLTPVIKGIFNACRTRKKTVEKESGKAV